VLTHAGQGPGGGSAFGAGDGEKPRSPFRNPFLYTSALFLLALVYLGWVFYARRQAARDLAAEAKIKKAAEDQQIVESLGGSRFEILGFYATPGIIHRGDSADLCYAVANAKTVRIEPPVGDVWPSYSRCIKISPTKNTTYTLTADDGSGNTKTETLTLEVR
jgi:cbb3-type cytochrome oxidase subunit 3